MAIRNSAKALILHDGKLLLNRCVSRLGIYYALPGGGQHDGELLTEAVRREVMEETGLTVEPMRMSAIFERVSEGRDGSVAHKMYFVFLCRYISDIPQEEPIVAATPVEKAYHQLALSWGVYPVLALNQNSTDDLFLHAVDCARNLDLVQTGDLVVITAGVPLSVSGTTNLLKVQTVG